MNWHCLLMLSYILLVVAVGIPWLWLMHVSCYIDKVKIIRLPTILHVHHGWQAANDAWMQLVHRWAIEHGFDCQILRITLAKIVRRMPVMHAIKPLAWS